MHTPTNPLPPAGNMGPIIDSIQSGIVVFDLAGRVAHANVYFCAMVGYSIEELRGQTAPFPYWDAGHVEECMAGLQAALEGRLAPAGIETTFVRKDGKPFEVRVRVQPLPPDAGAAGWVATILDVRAEEALRASEARFRSLVALSSDWYWEQDAQLRFFHLGPSRPNSEETFEADEASIEGKRRWEIEGGLLRQYKQDFDSIQGKRRWEIEGVTPLSCTWEEHRATIEARRTFRDFVYSRIYVDGKLHYVTASGEPVFDAQGAFAGYRGVARDITAERRVQDQLRESQKLEAIGQLTGGLAHDFNNLLGIAVGSLDEMSRRLPQEDHELRDWHRAALDAVLRGTEVTRSLLAVARRQPLEVDCYDLNTLLAEMLPLMRVSAGADIAVSEQLAAEPLWAQLDANGLSNVVLNLVINARDALQDVARNKRLALRTREEWVGEADPDLAAGRYAVLEVSDNGSGMSGAVSAQAFEPFFTTKERNQGTGLGLAMVRGYAEQLGGTARIDSAPGRDTSVRVYLPIDAVRAAAQAQRPVALDRDQTPVGAPAAGAVPPALVPAAPPVPVVEAQGAAARVLVVDDEEALCELACLWLESLGYRARAAHSAAAALELLEREPFELLFTDMVMPGGMDGMALAHKALALRPGLRVLITSGYAQRLLDKPNPPGQFLPKPYRKKELERALLALSASIKE